MEDAPPLLSLLLPVAFEGTQMEKLQRVCKLSLLKNLSALRTEGRGR